MDYLPNLMKKKEDVVDFEGGTSCRRGLLPSLMMKSFGHLPSFFKSLAMVEALNGPQNELRGLD